MIMADPDTEALFAQVEYLRDTLGELLFWGVTLSLLALLGYILLLSILLVSWLWRGFETVSLESPRWQGSDVLVVGASWFLLVMGSSILVETVRSQEIVSPPGLELIRVGLIFASSIGASLLVIFTTRHRYGQSLGALGVGT